ncbi:hypothetical protein [Campylobacter hyointestinalis]|nr:hypothetical protein [Campylobacter hyointestinalis]CUU71888.1 Uncharacterised protein [Campylobacter hyointestinalis subsp. hyointestinalis]
MNPNQKYFKEFIEFLENYKNKDGDYMFLSLAYDLFCYLKAVKKNSQI